MTLVYVDEPQLVALDSRKTKVVAVAVPQDGREFPFLAALTTGREWDRYILGMVDLRYLFVYSTKRSLFTFDLAKMSPDGKIMMEPVEEIPDEWLPDRQFFSRDHTEPMKGGPEKKLTGRQEFTIDGEWGLPDLAHFVDMFSDVYAFELAINKYKDGRVSASTKRSIVEAFTNYPFRGGSSYRYFYVDLSNALSMDERPDVKSFSYASPGSVVVSGRNDVFGKVNTAILNFQSNFYEIKDSYNRLYNHLRILKFLKLSPKRFDNQTPTAKTIMKEAEDLAALLDLGGVDSVKHLCGNNALAVAKIVLSYSRRVEGAFDFIAEGRASISD